MSYRMSNRIWIVVDNVVDELPNNQLYLNFHKVQTGALVFDMSSLFQNDRPWYRVFCQATGSIVLFKTKRW